jgi:RNA polymerase sigma-70 factor (ECF subfamily)
MVVVGDHSSRTRRAWQRQISFAVALLSWPLFENRGVGDTAETVFRRHYGQVYRYLRRRTGDHERAEDLAQQVFADAVVSLRVTESSPLAWLYTVAQRRFADELRREAVRRRAFALVAVPGSEAVEYGGDVAAAVTAGLGRLPEGQRQVVVLKLLRGLPFAEIGTITGVTADAAKMRFVRALEALRAELEQEGVAR